MNASPLPAYMQCPIVRESRLVRDLSMPERRWDRYDEPPRTRAPHFHAHYQDRMERRPVKFSDNVCMFHRRQA